MIGQTPDKTGHVHCCSPAHMGGQNGRTRTHPLRGVLSVRSAQALLPKCAGLIHHSFYLGRRHSRVAVDEVNQPIQRARVHGLTSRREAYRQLRGLARTPVVPPSRYDSADASEGSAFTVGHRRCLIWNGCDKRDDSDTPKHLITPHLLVFAPSAQCSVLSLLV